MSFVAMRPTPLSTEDPDVASASETSSHSSSSSSESVEPVRMPSPRTPWTPNSHMLSKYAPTMYLSTHVKELPPLEFRKELPGWSYADEVAELADLPIFHNDTVPMGLCVGPAVLAAKAVVVFEFVTVVGLACLAYATSQCTQKCYAEYATWVWLVAVPVFVVRLAMEWYCVRFAVIPYIQVCRSFRVLGCCKVSFHPWVVFGTLLSIINEMDMITDAFFVAVSAKTDTCSGKTIGTIWQLMLQQSMFKFLGSWLEWFPFHRVVFVVWVISFIQLAHPWLYSTPACGEDPVYYNVAFPEPGCKIATKKLQFENLLGQKDTNLGNALYALAEGSGLGLLNLHQPWYARYKLIAQLAVLENKVSLEFSEISKPLAILQGELERGKVRFLLVAVGENAVQIQLQITLLAMRMALESKIHWHMLLLIVTSIIMCTIRAVTCRDLINFSGVVQNKVKRLEGLESEDAQRMKNELVAIKANTRGIKMIAFLYAAVLIYSAVQLGMTYICEDSVWIISGCVDLSELSNQTKSP
eukprot:TRINITY_DN42698_c0_g1_i1.p1 TRINITY_DN42698_c0_g1~~TRINITY_DN42698_c0_g1_i1.p1  ORF type:complete len:526 (-),score=69.81 TRINITY_DN42698_c0_g1_i1:187-1764(-)